jgi:hypothetical protein
MLDKSNCCSYKLSSFGKLPKTTTFTQGREGPQGGYKHGGEEGKEGSKENSQEEIDNPQV